MNTVAIIGLGNMGLGMARALLARGFAVHGCDIAPAAAAAAQQAGVTMYPTPSAAVAHASTVFIVVVNAAQIDDVLKTLSPALTTKHTVLCMSTIAPQDATRFAVQIATTGAGAIDAPISGGPARAAAGELTVMLAGSASALTAAKPVCDAIANRSFTISADAGDASKVKLLNNLLAGINLAASAQVLRLAGELGIKPQALLDVMQVSSGQSWIADNRLPRALAGDFEPRSYMHILTKDVTLANAMLADAGYHLLLGVDAQAVFQAAIDAGMTLQDDCAVYCLPAETSNMGKNTVKENVDQGKAVL
jgi:3-hydroxyisobutyrate dehydrogenase